MNATIVEFSAEQERVVFGIEDWRSCGTKQYFTLAGYAGTGKTTIISYLAGSLPEVKVLAFCGKAANVLRERGTDAQTIHSLIYVPFKGRDGKVRFRKRDYLPGVQTIIVDEASMIDHLLLHDLLSYRIPTLLVGDPGQLEPIGTNPNVMKNPDFMLAEIHRQARGNPVIRLAAAFREGRPVKYWKDPRGRLELVPRRMFQGLIGPGKQIICGYNKTRHAVNARIREIGKLTGDIPQPGERLICLRNNRQFNIFNGQQAQCMAVYGERKRFIELEIETDDGRQIIVPALKEQFGHDVLKDFKGQNVALFDFGYCITAHKSQGSEWDEVLVLEEIAQAWDPRRWRYTAVTRAKKRLVYCG